MRTFLAAVLTALTFVAGGVLGSAPAHAHGAKPEASIPEENAVLDAAPERITLVFAEPIKTSGAALSVLGPDGAQLATAPATVDDRSLSVPLDPSPYRGVFKVAYRAIFEDGASSANRYVFTVTAGQTPPSSTAAPAAVPSPSPSLSASPASTVVATREATSEQGTAGPAAPRNWALIGGLAGVGLLLLIASVFTPTDFQRKDI